MKKQLENAPPEPREPAAREAVERFWLEWEARRDPPCLTNLKSAQNCSPVMIDFALAYSAELRAERDNAIKLRDEYLETGQRIQGDFERARSAYEASERSLLQAREALKPFTEVQPPYDHDNECSFCRTKEGEAHPDDCSWTIAKSIISKWRASTSALEGDDTK